MPRNQSTCESLTFPPAADRVPRKDGLTDQETTGVIDMPVDQYLQKVQPGEWGANIADYKGGEVKKVGPNQQIERMVLRSPGKDLDMTKVERLNEDRDAAGKLTGAQARWGGLETDNGTVLGDIGVLRFNPMQSGPPRVRGDSFAAFRESELARAAPLLRRQPSRRRARS